MDVETAPLSGDAEIDSLAESRWTGKALTFGFPTSGEQFTGYVAGEEPFLGFEPLNALQQAAVRTIYASIAGFTNLTFTEITGGAAASAVLRFGMTTEDEDTLAHAYLPSPSDLGGDSWFSNIDGDTDNPVRGNDAWHTFLHEIGHTLGLGHPHESTPAMTSGRDNMMYTVMSYQVGYMNDDWDYVQTYMVEDIAALQFLYGANFNTNNTDSVYRWNGATGEMSINGIGQGAPGSNRVYMTLWDGGGIDTYDLSSFAPDTSGYNGGLRIDLTPGMGVTRLQATNGNFSVMTVWNAFLHNGDTRSLIENAIGTTGYDIITGNDAANYLDGNGGGGEIYGLGGDDVLLGGGRLLGGDGNDTLSGGGSLEGGTGNDFLYGADGDDTLFGEDGNDTLVGGGGADRLVGGPGANSLDGGDGNDTLEGDSQVDILVGGAGNDKLYGYDGNDTMQGGAGDDTYYVEDVGDQVIEAAGNGTDTISSTVSIVASANVENLVLASLKYNTFLTGPALNATGNLLNNTISGNFQGNILDGGAGADTMSGGGGDDTYYVDNPGDLVYEQDGQGYDRVFSSVSYIFPDSPPPPPGYDPYAGASVRVWYTGPNSIEAITLTGTEDISATGNSLGNNLVGNAGANRLLGLAGHDTLTGGLGADTMLGGTGSDSFIYTSVADSIAGQEDWLGDFEYDWDRINLQPLIVTGITFQVFGGDPGSVWTQVTVQTDSTPMSINVAGTITLANFMYFLTEAPVDDTLIGTTGDDNLAGAGGHDTLFGLAGNDTLLGGTGNDSLDGGTGTDTMTGDSGNDVYYVDALADVVTEAAGGGYDTVFAGVTYSLKAGSEVEVLRAIDAAATTAINLTGNEFGQFLLGNAGSGIIDGRGGSDAMIGYAGDDWYYVDTFSDVVVEALGEGYDRVFTTSSHMLTAGSEIEVLSTANPYGLEAIHLTGNAFGQILLGNNAANSIDGGGGADAMYGFGGDDWYYVDSLIDLVSEAAGEGYDRVLASTSHLLAVGSEVEVLRAIDPASTAAIHLTGNEYGQLIYGNASGNSLDGGGGADAMIGYGGDDWYYADNAGDIVFEAAGGGYDRLLASANHVLAAGSEVELLMTRDATGAAALDLTGNEFGQYLFGNAGNNRIDGGGGSDALYGYGGNDRFAFTTALGAGNVDTIFDFGTSGPDSILLDDAMFAGLATGALNAAAFQLGASAQDADDRIVYHQATGALWFDADGSGAGAAVQFAWLSGGPALTASDFQVI